MNKLTYQGWAVASFLLGSMAGGELAFSKAEPAYEIKNKVTTLDELKVKEQDRFYKIENDRYELVKSMGEQDYLNSFWEDLAKKNKTTKAIAKEKYVKEHGSYTEKEFKDTFEQFKDHPSLKDLPVKEKEMQVRRFLESKGEQELAQRIIDKAVESKELVIKIAKPAEPIYNLVVDDKDHVRYGAKSTDVKPKGCSGNDCPITIIEYSEFQCPFCAKVMPAAKQILKEYEGKVRWVTRDFPLNFHDRARPAAIAAKCAAAQGPEKYWAMYEQLFDNQRKLADDDIKGYAKNINLDAKKFADCVSSPKDINDRIEANLMSGSQVGVTGTPAFFINGRRLSGALPYSEFKKVLDEEMMKVSQKASKTDTVKK